MIETALIVFLGIVTILVTVAGILGLFLIIKILMEQLF